MSATPKEVAKLIKNIEMEAEAILASTVPQTGDARKVGFNPRASFQRASSGFFQKIAHPKALTIEELINNLVKLLAVGTMSKDMRASIENEPFIGGKMKAALIFFVGLFQ
jgi:hypothetical protein